MSKARVNPHFKSKSIMARRDSCVPPKKRPSLDDSEEDEEYNPKNESANSRPPVKKPKALLQWGDSSSEDDTNEDDADDDEDYNDDSNPTGKKKSGTIEDKTTTSSQEAAKKDLQARGKDGFSSTNEYLQKVREAYPDKKSTKVAAAAKTTAKSSNKNNNRAVGDHPRTEKQQVDWQSRQQFQASLKNAEVTQRMFTPYTLMDTYQKGSDPVREVNEGAWPTVIPLKGTFTEMMPNKGGSTTLTRLARPKITFLVPSEARGKALEEVIKSGKYDLEMVTTADALMASIAPVKTDKKQAGKEPAEK